MSIEYYHERVAGFVEKVKCPEGIKVEIEVSKINPDKGTLWIHGLGVKVYKDFWFSEEVKGGSDTQIAYNTKLLIDSLIPRFFEACADNAVINTTRVRY